MGSEFIQVDYQSAVLALGRVQLSLQERDELGREMGLAMLLSIRRTFRDQGVPAGSWAPLAESTRKSNPRVYGAGHKLLILSGRLLNSITFAQAGDLVRIGTNLKYAPAQQYGSRDRRGAAIGPQARLADRSVQVGASQRDKAIHYTRRKVVKNGKTFYVPVAVDAGETVVFGKKGQRLKNAQVRKYIGPRQMMDVRAHSRFQNLPPRPFVVFRPEDPARLQNIGSLYVARKASSAGLEVQA